MAFIIFIATLVIVATFPGERAHSIFLIVFICAVILITVRVTVALLPRAFTCLESITEFSDVDTAIFPLVLALTLGFSLDISAREAVAIRENI